MRLKDNVIEQARTRQGWTQEHLALVAGVSTRTIQWVAASGIASADTAQALCAVLDLNFAEIGANQQVKRAVIALSIPALFCAFLIGLILGFVLAQFV
ncbi:helix-turn-helix domain-containing protein [Rhodobacteraceae bacterium]|nr:helix-turn-helix domain-containing protein [Paracoccaceae bacterium]